MASLTTLHTLFVMLGGVGMVLVGCSYITLDAWVTFMAGAVVLLAAAVLVWLRALQQICSVATQMQGAALTAKLLFRLFFVLPEMLNQALAGHAAKRVDRALPYSMVVFLVVLLTALVVVPHVAPAVLLALLLVMMRLMHQWRRAAAQLQEASPAPLEGAAAPVATKKQLPISLELFGSVLLNLLLAGIVVVLFSTFFIVPFEGRLTRARQKLVEIELKQALQTAAAYLASHPSERITSVRQLEQAGWHETAHIRLVRADMAATGGAITMQYRHRPGSRSEPVIVRLVYDGQESKTERVH